MSTHIEYGGVNGAGYGLLPAGKADEQWALGLEVPFESPFVLGLFTDNGDGMILEGDAEDILTYVDALHAHVRRELGAS